MACDFLSVPYESVILPYDDEQTPLALTGKKMLPIWEDGKSVLNESLDIISYIDGGGRLSSLDSDSMDRVETFLDEISGPLYKLAMPYFIYTPEFNESSRRYFQDKKEVKRGPFSQLVQKRRELEQELQLGLLRWEKHLQPWFLSKSFSLADVLVASHLWGLYVVPEFQFSVKWHEYLQSVGKTCHFEYHEDYWR